MVYIINILILNEFRGLRNEALHRMFNRVRIVFDINHLSTHAKEFVLLARIRACTMAKKPMLMTECGITMRDVIAKWCLRDVHITATSGQRRNPM
jgi:hypothetical protein